MGTRWWELCARPVTMHCASCSPSPPLPHPQVDTFPVEYIAGGATQNTIRVCQWISNTPGFTGFLGAVGDDAFGATLQAAAARDGVTTNYCIVPGKPTGTCAVLVHAKERSLVANLAAAEGYSSEHYHSAPVQALQASAEITYSAGFVLTHSPQIMEAMGAAAAAAGKVYAMNLAAPFLCAFFKDAMHKVLPYTDFVFGNETEAAAFGDANGHPGASVAEVALAIAALPKATGTRPRVVVITQGASPTVVVMGGVVRHVPVPPLAPEQIVDTNGAGDAFVGGFLAVLGKSIAPGSRLVVTDALLDAACAAGNWAAAHILGHSGCKFKPELKYTA